MQIDGFFEVIQMSPESPWKGGKRYALREYLRPWKLVSFAAGTVLLVVGAFYCQAPDWDVPISIVMASLTYLTAPWALRVFLTRLWRQWPAALFVTWFSVDGCYWIYWSYKDPVALAYMRSANFPASLSLYLICGAIWLFRGSLRGFLSELQLAWRARRPRRAAG